MATPPVLLEAAMSGPDRLFTEPRPVKLAQACLLAQALILVVPLLMLIQYFRWMSGEFTALALILMVVQTAAVLGVSALALLTGSRRNWVRLSAIWLQALVALRNLTAMVDDGASFWGALGLLVAGVGATQLLTEPAQNWFHLRGRQTS
ncbi:hypothetical protein AB0K40_32195 [Nonomuraea bangladeshensis]|uniref:ABC transporter permease n=1 Tax=Nonomuraea bangladeshensis TaxID=404385 RepID=A0ABV3HCQ2_9ACTN